MKPIAAPDFSPGIYKNEVPNQIKHEKTHTISWINHDNHGTADRCPNLEKHPSP